MPGYPWEAGRYNSEHLRAVISLGRLSLSRLVSLLLRTRGGEFFDNSPFYM